LPVAAIERRATSAAFYLTVVCLWPDVGFDDLIERTAVRALEWFCPNHDRYNALGESLERKLIQHTVRYTELAPTRFIY
jgi:hypothetical protein